MAKCVYLKRGISGNSGNVVYLKWKIPGAKRRENFFGVFLKKLPQKWKRCVPKRQNSRREAPGKIFGGVFEEIAAKINPKHGKYKGNTNEIENRNKNKEK